MISSIIISVLCVIILFWDLLALLNLFRSSTTVQCETLQSEKEEIRKDGYLTDEFWITKIAFEYNGKTKNAQIKTHSYSSPGQRIKCVYFPKQDTVIRKRDFRKIMNSTLSIILSVANLFMMLYLLFHFFDMSIILKINITKTLSCIIAGVFGIFGIGQIATAIIHSKKVKTKNIVYVDCVIHDIIRKTSSHKENALYTYYPIYCYTYKGDKHVVRSNLGVAEPPVKGNKIRLPIDKIKGGPLEYKDLKKSFLLGIVFLIMCAVFLLLLFYV